MYVFMYVCMYVCIQSYSQHCSVIRAKTSLTVDEGDSLAAVDVYPESGRLAMFLSAEMPHEVMPTFGDRHAITIWYVSVVCKG